MDGARLLEGMALAAATVILFRRHPTLANTLPFALAASAAVAALSSVLLWRGIGTAAALQRYQLIGYRVSAHVGDVNAAGSYFAMIVCLALGMAMRDRGARRAALVGPRRRERCRPLVLRIAQRAWRGRRRDQRRDRLDGDQPVQRAGARSRPWPLLVCADRRRGGPRAIARRRSHLPRRRLQSEQFVQTSVRMIAARPWFGVGDGQYYLSSPLFLSPQLAWTLRRRERAQLFPADRRRARPGRPRSVCDLAGRGARAGGAGAGAHAARRAAARASAAA